MEVREPIKKLSYYFSGGLTVPWIRVVMAEEVRNIYFIGRVDRFAEGLGVGY